MFRTSDTFATSEIDTLKSQISERNSRLKDIEQEIANYQTELKKVGGEKSTLQKAISRLELERKKVEAEINYTQNKISTTNLEISKIGIEIGSTQKKIELNHHAIEESGNDQCNQYPNNCGTDHRRCGLPASEEDCAEDTCHADGVLSTSGAK